MRKLQWLTIGAAGALSINVLGGRVLAQAPGGGKDINPPVANCSLTTDTIPDPNDPKKRIATPITAQLLTTGLPCQQSVSTNGLLANNPLGNLQRGFDFYSWLTFIALNSPADGKTIGQGPRPAATRRLNGKRWRITDRLLTSC